MYFWPDSLARRFCFGVFFILLKFLAKHVRLRRHLSAFQRSGSAYEAGDICPRMPAEGAPKGGAVIFATRQEWAWKDKSCA